MNPLLLLVFQQLPSLIAAIKMKHAEDNPDAPPLTDSTVIAALHEVVKASLAVDNAWLAAHPIK